MIVLHDWHGIGYYFTMAKHQGLAFQSNVLVTVVHCPSLFYLLGQRNHMSSVQNLASDTMEKYQVRGMRGHWYARS